MARIPVDFREVQNDSCTRCSNREQRRKHSTQGVCDVVSSCFDGLPARCVGRWGQEKVFYLLQYLGIFAQGMKNRWNGNLNYLEICSGPGRLIDYQTGIEFDGSAVAVLRHQSASLLKNATFVDINPKVVSALNERISTLNNLGQLTPCAVQGDYNSTESLKQVARQSGNSGLSLVFLDPTDMSFPFEAIKTLSAEIGHLDLLINVPLGHDFRRNATQSVLDEGFEKAREKYERFLGRPYFLSSLEVIDSLGKSANWPKTLSELFLDAYLEQLRSLDFCYFGVREVEHYYHLLFASRDKKGKEFWDKCQKVEFSGQRTLF